MSSASGARPHYGHYDTPSSAGGSTCGTGEDGNGTFALAKLMLGEDQAQRVILKMAQARHEGTLAGETAGKMRNSAKLKQLQRTPYSMILHRAKVLLERLRLLCEEEDAAALTVRATESTK
eukprot:evm.model.scf_1055.3 EVM.evm.TU.scf_1055.3   scf_1055:18397-19404(+)